MNKTKLTDAVVNRATLPEGKGDVVLWDTELTGFGLRLRPSGKTWVVAYRPAGTGRGGSFKRMRLGSTQQIRTASEARAAARVMLGNIATGADPLSERRAQKVRKTSTLDQLLTRYDGDLDRRGYARRGDVIRSLRKNLDGLMGRDVTTVTGAEIAVIVEKLEKAGKPGAAKGFFVLARAFLNWCATKARVLPLSPLAGHRRERATRADRIAKAEHGRALSDAELVKVWTAADPATSFGRMVRFLILSGCRRGEGAGLQWGMVDKQARLIRLPPSFVKQGRGHDVPIAPAMSALLASCVRDARSDTVFASERSGGPISGYHNLLTKLQKASGVAFSLHDLRRTMRTGLSRLGVEVDVAELALGHARADLERVYNRDAGLEALRSAFELWAGHVEALIAAEVEKQAAELFA